MKKVIDGYARSQAMAALSGAGRANDLSSQTTQSLETHKAESMSYVLEVTRDMSLSGIQTITLPFKAKSIIIRAVKYDTIQDSTGFVSTNVQHAQYYMPTKYRLLPNYAVALNDGVNIFKGNVINITETGFGINWERTGDPIGTAWLLILAITHGGV